MSQYPPPGGIPAYQPPAPKKKMPVWLIVVIVLGCLLVLCGVPFLVLMAIAVPNFLEAQVRSKVSRTRSDLRSMAVAIESYYIDYNSYPAHTVTASESSMQMASSAKPSFRLTNGSQRASLTTPVAYLTSYFPDAFAPVKGETFCYYAAGGGWIAWSPGPDLQYDIRAERDYNPASSTPTDQLLWVTFDPTNGTVSPGDIWRVKQ